MFHSYVSLPEGSTYVHSWWLGDKELPWQIICFISMPLKKWWPGDGAVGHGELRWMLGWLAQASNAGTKSEWTTFDATRLRNLGKHVLVWRGVLSKFGRRTAVYLSYLSMLSWTACFVTNSCHNFQHHTRAKKIRRKKTANPVKINLNHVFFPSPKIAWAIFLADWWDCFHGWPGQPTSFHLVIVGFSHKPGGYELRPSQAGTWQCVSELSWPRLFLVSLSTPDYVCSVGVFPRQPRDCKVFSDFLQSCRFEQISVSLCLSGAETQTELGGSKIP